MTISFGPSGYLLYSTIKMTKHLRFHIERNKKYLARRSILGIKFHLHHNKQAIKQYANLLGYLFQILFTKQRKRGWRNNYSVIYTLCISLVQIDCRLWIMNCYLPILEDSNCVEKLTQQGRNAYTEYLWTLSKQQLW